jgi:thymidylate synthase (FAD)
MEFARPKINIIACTELNYTGLDHVFKQYGAVKWYQENVYDDNSVSHGEVLTEIMARSCYKSFGVGLNPNVTKVRDGNAEYLANVLDSGHGSVLEHAMVSFMFQDVSRVFTHELVRHRVGCAISQESLRYVRLTELKCFDFPRLESELTEEEEAWFREVTKNVFEFLERNQRDMAIRFGLDDEASFARKKKLTSRMRRLAPIGLLTNIGWSANFRTLRHVIPLRTHKAAEEEMRLVFAEVGSMCKIRFPHIFFDMEWQTDGDSSGLGSWVFVNKDEREE